MDRIRKIYSTCKLAGGEEPNGADRHFDSNKIKQNTPFRTGAGRSNVVMVRQHFLGEKGIFS